MSESFLSEQQLLEYALTIPDGLRYILEAVSDLGIMETLRRMRNSFGCTVLFVETPILFSLQETDHDIPLTYSYPPRKELGMRGIWAFFLMYFRRSIPSTHVRVYWVGLRPPPSTIYLKIHLPTWIEVGEIAVIPTTPIGILQLQLLRYIPPRPCRCRLCRIRKMSATRQQRFFDKWGWRVWRRRTKGWRRMDGFVKRHWYLKGSKNCQRTSTRAFRWGGVFARVYDVAIS